MLASVLGGSAFFQLLFYMCARLWGPYIVSLDLSE